MKTVYQLCFGLKNNHILSDFFLSKYIFFLRYLLIQGLLPYIKIIYGLKYI